MPIFLSNTVEKAKVAKGGRDGTGGSEVYRPKWEYYSSLLFLYQEKSIDDGTIDSVVFNVHTVVFCSWKNNSQILFSQQSPPRKVMKTRSMAFIDSITALLLEMERDEPQLAIEFTRALRKSYTEFSDRFDDLKINTMTL